MSPAATENYSGNIDQILWSRIVFGSCAAMGVLPFFGWPLVLSVTSNTSALQTTNLILASVTAFPACLFAFRHRLAASIWLVVAAVLFVSFDFLERGSLQGDWYFAALLFLPGIFGLVSSAFALAPADREKN